MTIDRMLRRGVFPILSERPLDESETANMAIAKVYVVEVGAYSNRYIDAIFATRELAEAYVLHRQQVTFDREGVKAHQEVEQWSYQTEFTADDGAITFSYDGEGKARTESGRVIEGTPTYRDVPAETFEAFLKRHTWNEFGDVEEYDLWDVLPIALSE